MARPRPEPERRIGILTGWRCWTVLRDEALLRPIYQRGMIWKPRETYEAFCAAPDNPAGQRADVHSVPHSSCRCGIWAVCHPMLLQEVAWDWKENETLIVGQVALWGRVIEFERGWRAQFGYPTHLYALTDDALLAQTLRERYQVPVAAGAAAWALERILPPNLQAPGRAERSPSAAAEEMPAVPFALAGIVEMVQSTEAGELERRRENLHQAEARLKMAREFLAVERQRLKRERQEQLVLLERTAIELTRRREKAESVRPPRSATAPAPRPELVARAADLKQQMKDRGINQAQVAIAAGVTRTAVCHALAGRRDSHVLEVLETMLGRGSPPASDLRAVGLRARLRELGWTQTDLAKHLNVTPQRVSQILRSHRGGNTLLWKRIEQLVQKRTKEK